MAQVPDGMNYIDFRTKVTEITAQVLEAHARADGSTQSEVARDVLDKWAKAQVHKSMLVQRLTRGEGFSGDSERQSRESA